MTATDTTFDAALTGLWAVVELCCATMCLNAPILRPLFGQVRRLRMPAAFFTNRGSKQSGSEEAHGVNIYEEGGEEEEEARGARMSEPQLESDSGAGSAAAPPSTRGGKACRANESRWDGEALDPTVRTSCSMEQRWHSPRARKENSAMEARCEEVDEDVEAFALHDDEHFATLYPPPRGYGGRVSSSTCDAGRSARSVGFADSPVLKGQTDVRKSYTAIG